MLGHSPAIIRRMAYIVSVMRDTAHQVVADLVVVGRTRSGTIGLGVQGSILKIDRVAPRPFLVPGSAIRSRNAMTAEVFEFKEGCTAPALVVVREH
jgi:hypothetical protein